MNNYASKRSLFVVCIAFIAFCLVGCPQPSSQSNTTQPKRVRVVATTTMIADMIRQVGGERVEVYTLMGAGVDPHLYKAKSSDLLNMHQADVIFHNGLHLEGLMSELLEQMARDGKPTMAVSSRIPEEKILHSHLDRSAHDPHIWFDPTLWAECIPVVVDKLKEVDSAGATYYEERGKAYQQSLLDLHSWALERVSQIPPANRILITSHDAFNYFGRAYNFQVVGVQGISTMSEAGLADITKTIDFIKQHHIKAIFVESSVPKMHIERIASDSGAKVGGELFSDAAGTLGEIETRSGESYDVGTYMGMVKHNVNAVVEALK